MTLREKHKEVWKLMSLWVRKRDDNTCLICRQEGGDAAHFIHGRMDFDEFNINCLCRSCHTLNDHIKYGIMLDRKYGRGIAQSIIDRRYEIQRYTISDLEEIEINLKDKLGIW